MNAYSTHRFSDADVREDPHLLADAIEYARDYHGDFDFLVAAKALVYETGVLPIAVARAVLNCMRADPRASINRQPVPVTPLYSAPRIAPPKKQQRWSLDIPLRFKKPYGMAKNGKVLHVIDNEETFCRWRRDSDDEPLRPDELYLYWKCGVYTRSLGALFDKKDAARMHPTGMCRSGCWDG